MSPATAGAFGSSYPGANSPTYPYGHGHDRGAPSYAPAYGYASSPYSGYGPPAPRGYGYPSYGPAWWGQGGDPWPSYWYDRAGGYPSYWYEPGSRAPSSWPR